MIFTSEDHTFQPEDPNILLWRYMDLEKLISCISKSSLYFPSVSLFEDPYEGSMPKLAIQKRSKNTESLMGKAPSPLLEKNFSSLYKLYAVHTYASCWHHSDVESEAMWRLYCVNNKGVAIKTTYKNLLESLEPDLAFGTHIAASLVNYINYNNEAFSDANISYYARYIHKRKSFEHEREVRLLIQTTPDGVQRDGIWEVRDIDAVPKGINVDVSLSKLIQEIYVSPYSPSWYYDVVVEVLDKFGFKNTKPMISSMAEIPAF